MYARTIKTLRRKAMMSREELAEKAGLSRQTVWCVETAKSVPDTATLIKLARALGVDVRELVKGA